MVTVSPGWPARMASASRESGDAVGMPDCRRNALLCTSGASRSSGSGGRPSPSFFEQGLQFGNDLQILGAAGGALELNELLKAHEPATYTEGLNFLGGRQELFEKPTASHLAQQVPIN